MFNVRPPAVLVRHYLLGYDATARLFEKFYSAISSPQSEVLSERVKSALRVDVRERFYHLQLPVLWLYASNDKLLKNPHPEKELRQNSNCLVDSMDAPHLLLQTKSEQACAAIQKFLNDVIAKTNQ